MVSRCRLLRHYLLHVPNGSTCTWCRTTKAIASPSTSPTPTKAAFGRSPCSSIEIGFVEGKARRSSRHNDAAELRKATARATRRNLNIGDLQIHESIRSHVVDGSTIGAAVHRWNIWSTKTGTWEAVTTCIDGNTVERRISSGGIHTSTRELCARSCDRFAIKKFSQDQCPRWKSARQHR